uniref:TBC1 domain family, member 22a n=1 Tax=Hucho hucho TaxID=62062 RepID=A0A4W5KX43_9TELE
MSTDGNKKQFWKRSAAKVPGSIQHVYGAQHPPFNPLLHANLITAGNKPQTTPGGKPKKATTFQEFESITSDAWDVGDDDDDELLAMAAQKLNIEVVMETANKVIENHSKQQEKQRRDDADASELEDREEEEAHEEEVEEQGEEGEESTPEVSFASEPSPLSDGRLVKSLSEAPIGSPKEGGVYASLHRQQSLPHRPTIPMVARIADQNTSGTPAMTEREASRLDKFRQVLAGPNTDLEELRKLSWSGIPRQVRPITWKLLSGYLPANTERRESTLQRKRQEYFGFIEQYYDSRNAEHHQDTYRQVRMLCMTTHTHTQSHSLSFSLILSLSLFRSSSPLSFCIPISTEPFSSTVDPFQWWISIIPPQLLHSSSIPVVDKYHSSSAPPHSSTVHPFQWWISIIPPQFIHSSGG